jgi:hypothetical protein
MGGKVLNGFIWLGIGTTGGLTVSGFTEWFKSPCAPVRTRAGSGKWFKSLCKYMPYATHVSHMRHLGRVCNRDFWITSHCQHLYLQVHRDFWITSHCQHLYLQVHRDFWIASNCQHLYLQAHRDFWITSHFHHLYLQVHRDFWITLYDQRVIRGSVWERKHKNALSCTTEIKTMVYTITQATLCCVGHTRCLGHHAFVHLCN